MSDAAARIGFMQGRLSPQINGMIQCFPWEAWRDEYATAQQIGFALMEWTLDQARIEQNPLMTSAGREQIAALSAQTGVAVSSVTGDCFMQAPFWKAGRARQSLINTFDAVIRNAAAIGARLIVTPLVDNGAVTTDAERADLLDGMSELAPVLRACGCAIAFESDFEPSRLADFIKDFPTDLFGVNFDIGNSASLGWAPQVEIPLLASRLLNVHVKDRLFGGATVPLGEGAADFKAVFALLKAHGYTGRFILQTARDPAGNHALAAAKYRAMTMEWLATA